MLCPRLMGVKGGLRLARRGGADSARGLCYEETEELIRKIPAVLFLSQARMKLVYAPAYLVPQNRKGQRYWGDQKKEQVLEVGMKKRGHFQRGKETEIMIAHIINKPNTLPPSP